MGRLVSCRQLLPAVVVVAAVTPAGVLAAQVAQTPSRLQTCLDSSFDMWLKSRVNLVLNEDPKAGDIDDPAVGKWTVDTVAACRAQAGSSDAAVEETFAKQMGQWREHIYNAVQRMRELVKPD